jgi:hypothetical protein
MSAIQTLGRIAFPWQTEVKNADTIADYVGGDRGLGRVVTGGVNATVKGALALEAGREAFKQGDKMVGNVATSHYGDAIINGLGLGLFGLAATQMATGAVASARSMIVNEGKYGAESKE